MQATGHVVCLCDRVMETGNAKLVFTKHQEMLDLLAK